MTVSSPERKYILYAGGFALVYFFYLLDYLKSKVGNNPYTMFLVFTLGLFLFFFIFLKTITLKTSTDIQGSFGLLATVLAIDLLSPEYHLNKAGELIVGANLGAATTDYVLGLFGQNLGIQGLSLFFFVYVITPVILLYIASVALPNFIEEL